MKNHLYALFILVILAVGSVNAQVVTHGPVTGGVSDTACTIVIKTDAATAFSLQLATDAAFTNIAATVNSNTSSANNLYQSTTVSGLQPGTKYYVRTLINATPSGPVSSFKTFNVPGATGEVLILAGSCINDLTDADSSLFVQAASENADLFIQMGDWGYPDGDGWLDMYLTNPPTSWAADYNNIVSLYNERYTSPSHSSFFRTLPIDHVYDDHDYLNDGAGEFGTLGFNIGFSGTFGAPKMINMPAAARNNSIQGYANMFPHYNLADTSKGIYHNYRVGNCEVFVVDTRAQRGPNLVTYSKVGGNWQYTPDPGTSILGPEQMDWLLTGLSNSTATWKFIVSSVPFNVGMRFGLDSCLKIGDGGIDYWAPEAQGITLPNRGYTAAQIFADSWSGFKQDGDTLINHVISNNIKNVFMITADSHTVGLDDGTNSGLPELNCGNLKKANSEDWKIFQQFMGFNIWNKGGSGLCGNSNFNSSYARLQVFADDSVHISAVNSNGAEVCGHTFMVNEPYKYNPNYIPNRLPVAVNDNITINMNQPTVLNTVANDYDPEQDNLTTTILTQTLHGTVALSGNTITYTPQTGYTGIDSFNYRICDDANPACLGCSDALVILTVNPPAGVSNPTESFFKVYPNPASSVLNVECEQTTVPTTLKLFNAEGKAVLEYICKQNKCSIDISGLAAGYYNYVITGSTTQKGNVVIKK